MRKEKRKEAFISGGQKRMKEKKERHEFCHPEREGGSTHEYCSPLYFLCDMRLPP